MQPNLPLEFRALDQSVRKCLEGPLSKDPKFNALRSLLRPNLGVSTKGKKINLAAYKNLLKAKAVCIKATLQSVENNHLL